MKYFMFQLSGLTELMTMMTMEWYK